MFPSPPAGPSRTDQRPDEAVELTTVKACRKLEVLPVAVQIACSAMKRERDVFLAHYRPRTNGLPKKKGHAAAAG